MIRPNIAAMAGYVPGEQPQGQKIIKLNTNESPYPPTPRVFEALQNVLSGDFLRKYPDPMGNAFRKAAAGILNVEPSMILPGNGSDDLLTIITRTFVPEKGLLSSPTPSYILYRNLAEIQGAQFAQVPFTTDWKLPDKWPFPQAHLTLVPNPNSPSGTLLENSDLRHLHQQLSGAFVVDEAYVDFASHNALELIHNGAIITRTFSKSYSLAGIRFGYCVAKPEMIHEFTKVKDSYNCDAISLALATAAILDQPYLQEVCHKIAATRERMQHKLEELGFTVTPSHANFLWCQRTDRRVKPIYEALKEKNILVRYMNYQGYGDGLRISVGTDQEMDELFLQLQTIV